MQEIPIFKSLLSGPLKNFGLVLIIRGPDFAFCNSNLLGEFRNFFRGLGLRKTFPHFRPMCGGELKQTSRANFKQN